MAFDISTAPLEANKLWSNEFNIQKESICIYMYTYI